MKTVTVTTYFTFFLFFFLLGDIFCCCFVFPAIAKVEGRKWEAEGGESGPDAGRFQIDGQCRTGIHFFLFLQFLLLLLFTLRQFCEFIFFFFLHRRQIGTRTALLKIHARNKIPLPKKTNNIREWLLLPALYPPFFPPKHPHNIHADKMWTKMHKASDQSFVGCWPATLHSTFSIIIFCSRFKTFCVCMLSFLLSAYTSQLLLLFHLG